MADPRNRNELNETDCSGGWGVRPDHRPHSNVEPVDFVDERRRLQRIEAGGESRRPVPKEA